MITDNADFWENKALQPEWREVILPGRTDDEFEAEGAIQATRLSALINPGSVVIDYGCGVGRVTRYLKLWAKKAIGLDACFAFIEKANERNKGIEGLSFYHVTDFAGKENVAHLVVCLMVMQHNSPEARGKIIADIYRLLKPKGVAVVSFPSEKSKTYKETKFVHVFGKNEVEEYGKQFDTFFIEEGNLAAYRKHCADGMNEYFLVAQK